MDGKKRGFKKGMGGKNGKRNSSGHEKIIPRGFLNKRNNGGQQQRNENNGV